MAIYEVFGVKDIGHKVLDIERFYGAKDAVDAVKKMIKIYSSSKDKGKVTITELRVWGTSGTDSDGRVGHPTYDPNTLCDCHSSPLWKCPKVLPPTVSIASDGISFTAGG